MNVAIIVAAGRGSRAGGARAKQFREISGIPIIIHTLSRFELCETISAAVVVLPGDACGEFQALAAGHGLRKVSRAVAGGETRAESVWRGLEALPGEGVEVVAVHDGVRPFVTPAEIDRTVREASGHGAALLAAPAVETVKEVEDGRVVRTLERARLWQAQTPQCFRVELLRRAYGQPGALGPDVTDCSALVERLGETVRVVEGGADNIKITTQRDFAIAEVLMNKFRYQG
ncbi:MAG TPA: 2-C-methyl-D-erythritol 4-phosphate cytidylyltransferase [Pyrinomonadaceae bacterium]|nr:2-C-methyl-D-erythritol 4-phosphate cytidylyltransferase [Pyrinomonadaceae bacterium]